MANTVLLKLNLCLAKYCQFVVFVDFFLAMSVTNAFSPPWAYASLLRFWLAHPSWLHRFSWASCVMQTPPSMAPLVQPWSSSLHHWYTCSVHIRLCPEAIGQKFNILVLYLLTYLVAWYPTHHYVFLQCRHHCRWMHWIVALFSSCRGEKKTPFSVCMWIVWMEMKWTAKSQNVSKIFEQKCQHEVYWFPTAGCESWLNVCTVTISVNSLS